MTTQDPGGCAESRKWLTHFSLRSMTALHVSRLEANQLTERERRIITPSIQQFQLGEGSRGQRLLERGRKYSVATNDALFVPALELFIKEERQHSAYLAAFMESQSIPLLQKHWVDTVFRNLRALAGLELSLTVLVTAEIIAVPYYRALRCATNSPILGMVCTRILTDEASHLKYQGSMLGRVASRRPRWLQRAISEVHRMFFLGTLLVVWFEHRGVLAAGGYSYRQFQNEALAEFTAWSTLRTALTQREVAQQKSLTQNFERVKPQA